MKWPKFLLAAIALHLLVLFAFTWTTAKHVHEEDHYAEVTLEAPPPEPPPSPPAPQPPPETIDLGLARGKKSDNPVPDAGNPADAPASPPEAMALVPTLETPDIPVDDMTRQAADKAGPDTPGVIGGHGNGGGGSPYIVVWAPEGITWDDARIAALAWGGRLANLQSDQEEQQVFKLADDPKFWNTSGNASIGPWLGGDFRLKPHQSPNGPTNNWGAAFQGTSEGQRQADAGYTPLGVLAHGFVVKREQFKIREEDISVNKGQLNGHTFEVFAAKPPGITWFEAQMQAEARGGYLAIIHTGQENNFIYSLCSKQPSLWSGHGNYPKLEAKDGLQSAPAMSVKYGPWLGGFVLWDRAQSHVLIAQPTARSSVKDSEAFTGQSPYSWYHLWNIPDATGWLKDDPIPFPPPFLIGQLPQGGWGRVYEGDTGILETGFGTRLPNKVNAKTSSAIAGLPELGGIASGIKLTEWTVSEPGRQRQVASWATMRMSALTISYIVEYDDPIAAK